MRAGRADIAIVDGRFEADGLAFCEQLWAEYAGFPVLLIGPNDENLVTKALTSGADDYLALPLRPAELVAHVRAVLRRAPHWVGDGGHHEPAIRVGEVRLDPESHEVTLRAARLHLPLREFELLRLLMENAGIVLPRATLLNRLWLDAAGKHEPGGPYQAPAGQTRGQPGQPEAHSNCTRYRLPLSGRALSLARVHRLMGCLLLCVYFSFN